VTASVELWRRKKMNKRAFIVSCVLLLFPLQVCAATCGSSQFDAEKVSVTDTSISSSRNGNALVVTTIGTIRNSSEALLEDIVMEVKYFDADKKLIDVVTQPLYGVVVPPSQEVAFRVRDAADKPKTSYVSNSVRVVSAEQRAPQRQQSSERAPQRQQSSQSSFSWSELLISSAPLLLLIGVMLFSIRSMNSPLIRNVELMEKQNALLERLAVAAEKLAPETRS
jgi:hypothetical protein